MDTNHLKVLSNLLFLQEFSSLESILTHSEGIGQVIWKKPWICTNKYCVVHRSRLDSGMKDGRAGFSGHEAKFYSKLRWSGKLVQSSHPNISFLSSCLQTTQNTHFLQNLERYHFNAKNCLPDPSSLFFPPRVKIFHPGEP